MFLETILNSKKKIFSYNDFQKILIPEIDRKPFQIIFDKFILEMYINFENFTIEKGQENNTQDYKHLSLTTSGKNYYLFLKEKLKNEKLSESVTSSVIKTNNLTILNILATIILGVIVAYIQFKTNQRENRKEEREMQQTSIDSIKSLKQTLSDSIFHIEVLRIVSEKKDSSKK